LRKISSSIDRFCLKHRKFGIPRLVEGVIGASVLVYIIGLMDTTGTFYSFLTFSPERILHGEIWRLVTWIFFPFAIESSSVAGVVTTALMLYFFFVISRNLIQAWGSAKFSLYYLLGVALHVIYGVVMWYAFPMMRVFIMLFLSPTYLNLSIFVAFALLYPNDRILLFMIIPIRALWLAVGVGAYCAFLMIRDIISGLYFTAFLPIPALITLLLVCGETLFAYRPARRSRGRTVKRTITVTEPIDFKSAAKQVKRKTDGAPYRHKCEVCGKTNIDSPGMDFRYCSRCDGYHCYCGEHINSHTHVVE
jgi:hypothetical protein